MSQSQIIPGRKRDQLKKAYLVSKAITVDYRDSETGELHEMELFIKKLTPIQDREAARESYKSKVKFEILKREDNLHPDRLRLAASLDYQGYETRDDLVLYVAADELAKYRLSAEFRVSDRKEWSENNYLDTLRDAWFEGGMKDVYDRDNDDPEAKPIFDALVKWTNQVEEEFAQDRDNHLVGYEVYTEEELLTKAIDRALEYQANSAQIEEHNNWRMYFAVFEDAEFRQHFFDSPDEVRDWPDDFIDNLVVEYEDIAVGVLEGKG